MSAESTAPSAPPVRRKRRLLRFVLMVVLPVAVVAGAGFAWLHGGRYVTTDNSYVGAEKVLVTPEVTGRVTGIFVQEGQMLKPGDRLFEVDAEPYRIALAAAEAKLGQVRTDFGMLKANLESLVRQSDLQRQTLALRQAELDRKTSLLGSRVVSHTDVETAQIALTEARTRLEQLAQQAVAIRTQILGDPDLPIEKYPAFQEAVAAADKARRDLGATVLRAPIAGMATQVSSIQMGRWLAAGTAVFAIVGVDRPWIDANPKETDLAHLHPGQPVTVTIDAYPDRTFSGTVELISPGTGAQFAILPPQNASGNWVKVVQRVPVRVALDPGPGLDGLRAGMSANVSIDTGRTRSIAGLLGLQAVAESGKK